jgi:hypothetical protein
MTNTPLELFYSNINYGQPDLKNIWDAIYINANSELKFQIDIARKFGKNRLVARNGCWNTSWAQKIIPEFEMPSTDEKFSKSFTQITNERSEEIRQVILNSESQRIVVLYSGGIDSTICLSSLIQNLNKEELSRVDICMSSESIVENPIFYDKFIKGKFNILDSALFNYQEIEAAGNIALTSDLGDSIFGTELGNEFYLKHSDLNPEDSFLKHSDKIIQFFNLNSSLQFSKIFYQRLIENINTAKIDIFSIHDFFWWYIFNLKYMDCALRGPVFYHYGDTNREKTIKENILHWFNTTDYQKWSLTNNNNGQKIRGNSAATYKWAGRQYIYQFDKSEWQFRYKLKISSLINISYRTKNRNMSKNIFALDSKFNLISINSPEFRSLINNQADCHNT